jgi:hypothetical protein
MDRPTAVLVGGLAYALTWGTGGALFGATVRAFGRRRRAAHAPGSTMARALFSGARFGAVAGFLCGGVISYLLDAPANFVRDLVSSSILIGMIAFFAIVFGFIANGLEWLGTSAQSKNESEPKEEEEA